MLKEILIIEDNETTSFLHMRLLEKMNVTDKTTWKSNGQIALNYLSDQKKNNKGYPDIIFLDIKMPVMDGFEFMKEFNTVETKASNRPAIVVVSTSELDSDYNRAKKLGANLYINKYLDADKTARALQVLNQ
ncbi:MAG: response regulator [Flavobacteriales bacterium]|nr:response regulator [Flavobacteriales bacterium]